jgi:hypothetical protein
MRHADTDTDYTDNDNMAVTRLSLLSIAARSNTTIVRDWRHIAY